MKWAEVSDNWVAMTDSIKARWPEVDSDAVADMTGDRKVFNAYLGQVCGLTPREADEQIEEWLQGPMPTDALADEHHDNASIRDSGRHIPVGEDVYADDAAFGDEQIPEPPVGRD